MIRIIDKDSVIDREMNEAEFLKYNQFQEEEQLRVAEAEAKAAQKAALLDRLGITEDEAKLLLA